MLYTTLLRAFSAVILVSALTACGGGGGSGDETTPPTTNPGTTPTTPATPTTPTDPVTPTTPATPVTPTNPTTPTTPVTPSTPTTPTTPTNPGPGGASGVWRLELTDEFVKAMEDLNSDVGIVDEWLPGRQIVVIDHGTFIDVSTCIDNPNLPSTRLVQNSITKAYVSDTKWAISGFEITPIIARQTDGSFNLQLFLGVIQLGDDIRVKPRTALNNRFTLEGDGITAADTTNLTCAVTDVSDTLHVATWYEDSFLYLSFPGIADVGHYDYLDEVKLVSDPLYFLVGNEVSSAQLDLSLHEPDKLKLVVDLLTGHAAQLHGEVTLQENPL